MPFRAMMYDGQDRRAECCLHPLSLTAKYELGKLSTNPRRLEQAPLLDMAENVEASKQEHELNDASDIDSLPNRRSSIIYVRSFSWPWRAGQVAASGGTREQISDGNNLELIGVCE